MSAGTSAWVLTRSNYQCKCHTFLCQLLFFPFSFYPMCFFIDPLDTKYLKPFISFWIPHNWRHKNWTVNMFYLVMRFIYCVYQIWRHCVQLCDYTWVYDIAENRQAQKFCNCILEKKNAVQNLSFVETELAVRKPKFHSCCKQILFDFFEDFKWTVLISNSVSRSNTADCYQSCYAVDLCVL
jgi:hypothetical protein